MNDCKHDWRRLTTAFESYHDPSDRFEVVVCLDCCEMLNADEIKRSRDAELQRLTIELVNAQYGLQYGDNQIHYPEYRAAFTAYREFRQLHYSSPNLALPI